MFTEISNRRPAARRSDSATRPRRGRPRGVTERGIASRRRLFDVAIELIASRGYEETTLRLIAKRARVSVGLLYRYFPSKEAVLLALYDELSGEYAARASEMPAGAWTARFLFALRASLEVLGRHRRALVALTPVLVGDARDGIFAPATVESRQRVQAVFREVVREASDAPTDGAVLGDLLYVAHLAVVLWWLLDKSPDQAATSRLLATVGGALPMATGALELEPFKSLARTAHVLCQQGLFGNHRVSG